MMNLRLCNFQAWSDATIELRGLTIIVGDSCLGKSSFARAVRRAVRNEVASGNIKLGAPKTSIHLNYKGLSLLVERGAKSKDTPVYTVNGEVFEKLGGEVPQAVKDMRFGPVEVNGTSIDPCFAKQFDNQFLVDSKPAELNAVLNAFASTEKLDRGRKAMASEIADINAQAKALAPQISALEEQSAALAGQIAEASGPVALATTLMAGVQAKTRAQVGAKNLQGTRAAIGTIEKQLGSVEWTTYRLTQALGLYKVQVRTRAAQEAHSRAQEAAQGVRHLSRVDGATDRPMALLRAREATARLSTSTWAKARTSVQLTGLEAIAPTLNRCLVLHKARVRVNAMWEANPAPIRALLEKVQDLPVDRPATILKAAIIAKKLMASGEKLADLRAQMNTLLTDITTIHAERDAVEAEIDAARKAGVLTTCPKCGHEFTTTHTH